MADPIPFSEDFEQIPADEAQDTERILGIMREIFQHKQHRGGQLSRDVHVKSHGCAKGEFIVRPDLPPELAQGLFAIPRTFSAFVRFSNSAPGIQPDVVPDGRGMALQIESDLSPRISADNSSRTQDFVMVNHPVFIARHVKDYLQIEEARLQASLQPVKVVTKLLWSALHPMQWRWRAMLAAARVAGQLPSHPCSYTYYSMVPIRFGRYVAKYRIVSCGSLSTTLLSHITAFGLHADAMRRLLEMTLAQQEVKFEFQVQLRTSLESMPIEDATIEWPESESEYQTVADLVFPRQDVSALKKEGDQRTFSVWNGLADHRPLGGINRVRQRVYFLSASNRNSQPPHRS